ncbi:MAG: glycosyltransferase family 9 protein [Anaerolinea sp.]|nr:glycosyltransferase family 9 protein [Anaerolinea sp.]
MARDTLAKEWGREALVMRNRAMAEAFHAVPTKHRLRHIALRLAALLPIPAQQPHEKDRILLIRPDHVGDVLLTTPAIRALRRARPDAELHALIGGWSADVIANYDEIDYALTLEFPGFTRQSKLNWRSPYELLIESARHLRRIGYSHAIIFRPDHWWGALLAFAAGIPVRIGYDLPDVAPFLTHPVAHQQQHVVLQSAKLVEPLTGKLTPDNLSLTYPVGEADRAWVDGYLAEWGMSSRLFVIHPGSGTWVKRWDEAKWSTVADTLIEQLDAEVVFTGGDHELALVQRIAGGMQNKTRVCVMVGETRISSLAALYERALVVLGADSGPLHLAAAVQAPTVALFGPADPGEFRQWGDPARHVVLTSNIGCRPCRILDWGGDDPANHPCVREIPVGSVLEAARRVSNPG